MSSQKIADPSTETQTDTSEPWEKGPWSPRKEELPTKRIDRGLPGEPDGTSPKRHGDDDL